jgi:hypothetical protein
LTGQSVEADRLMGMGGDAVAAIIAAGCGYPSDGKSRSGSKRFAGKAISLALLRRGRNPGGRGSVHLVPLYVGIDVAAIPERFAILDAIERAAERLPALYLQALRRQ